MFRRFGSQVTVIQRGPIGMLGGVRAATLRDAIFAHPTLAESLNNSRQTG